ncbi:PilZ domain-containing protein [Kushneria indalinina]|uniref:Type IV pilus assembly protein PilZ n=1 Tax=Kushneria indalinina DSM 14324 TaxID=1122140 RepID=A0A3D9DZK2_9GAMM|nr:PilZ domain-containing protein [Kushneria indalinina]REC96085.1 type IV pilus assembly protein PilZ [Kushneria indalinina DSM 14324]
MSAARALSFTFHDTDALKTAWMPILERGGLFVPTSARHRLGQRVYLLLTLPGEQEPRPASGIVAWLSPSGMAGQQDGGVGVHLDAEEHALREHIEALLA